MQSIFHVKQQILLTTPMILYHMRRFAPLEQFHKLEKHSWRSITFSKVAGFSLQLY